MGVLFKSLAPSIIKFAVVILLMWLASVKFKPVIALFLAVKDFIKLDKHKFRGYGFWLFCGLGGSGKTLSMVEYLTRVKRQYPKVKIYTNFNYALSDGIISSWQDIIEKENFELLECSKEYFDTLCNYNRLCKNGKYYEKIHNGVIFGFDEIHLTFASQDWANCPDNMLEYISQQRKLHKQIVASAQVFTRVDKKLREQTNFVVECKSIFMGRLILNRFFNTSEYLMGGEKGDSGKRRRRRSKRYSFVAYDGIRNKYDTMQVMKDLSVGKSDKQQFADELLKRLKDV